MRLRCHRPSLTAAFQVVSGVIPSRTPKDILKNVKLQVADGKATLIGTDQEVGIRYDIPGVEIESDGEALLPTNRVTSILREVNDDCVMLELTNDAMWIRAAHSDFRLSVADPVEFPPVSAFDQERYYVVSGDVFRESVRRTVFATDVESTRYALGGILLEFGSETMTMAATDSRRLAVVKNVCRFHGIDEPDGQKAVVLSKAMSLVERSITEGNEEVFVAIRSNDVLFRCGNSTICSLLVVGRFPNYRDVIPATTQKSIDLNVGPFFSAVRQAQIVTDEESRGVEFSFTQGTLTLKSQAADIGQSKVELPISFEGEEFVITFDPRFVADFLRVLEAESQIKFELTDAESAAVLRIDDTYTYVIMPLSRDR